MITMARTITVSLGPHYQELIRKTIEDGRFNNASEVIRAALRNFELEQERIEALKAAIDEGDTSPDVIGFDSKAFLAELQQEWQGNE